MELIFLFLGILAKTGYKRILVNKWHILYFSFPGNLMITWEKYINSL